MSRQKKEPPSHRAMIRSITEVEGRLATLLTLQLQNVFCPKLQEISTAEEQEKNEILSKLQLMSGSDLFRALSPSVATVISTPYSSTGFSVEHAPIIRDNFLKQATLTTSGRVQLANGEQLDNEEIKNAFVLWAAAKTLLSKWLLQFIPGGYTGYDGPFYDEDIVARICAISPLWRTCMVFSERFVAVKTYKYGPRGLEDIQPMPEQLVMALRVAANLPPLAS